jgi:hypothetical protein
LVGFNVVDATLAINAVEATHGCVIDELRVRPHERLELLPGKGAERTAQRSGLLSF